MFIIYHHPRCSKSRGALELAQQFATQKQLNLKVVDYQATPLTVPQLKELHQVLQSEQAINVREMIRENETQFAALALQGATDEVLFQALANYQQLLQRPIVRYGNRALIARPPELLHTILPAY